jgi:hypothetical protein
LRATLRLVADLARHADDKRARFGSSWRAGTIGRTPEQPLPYDPRVTTVLDKVHTALRAARDLAQGADPSPVLSTDHPSALAIWLTSRLDVIRRHPQGPAMFRRLTNAGEQMVALFDRPPEKVYMGRCDHDACAESLYMDRNHTATVVKCPKCAHETPIAERREKVALDVEDYHGTVKEISHLLRETLGDDVSRDMINGMIRRHLIHSKGDRQERDRKNELRTVAVYRIGDVQAAVAKVRQSKDERRAVRRHVREEKTA